MADISLDEIMAGVKALASINFTGMLEAFRTKDIDGEFKAAEDVVGVIAMFVPEAVYVKDGLMVLQFIEKARQAGLWAPADPNSQAMSHASGRQTGTPQMHQSPIIVPGGSETDPYNFAGEEK